MYIKNYIKIDGLPKIQYAHIFGRDGYKAQFDGKKGANTQMEICYITKGVLNYTLENGTRITAPERSLVCYLLHEAIQFETSEYHEHHTIRFDIPFEFTHYSEQDTAMGNGIICLPFIIPALPENNKFLPLIDKIILNYTMHKDAHFECTALIVQLLSMIDKYARAENASPAYANKKYVKKAKKYIFEHLGEPILQSDIAEHLQITPEYLCSIFKRAEGVSVIHFINRVKLEQIRDIMKNNGVTLATACEIYGYSDPNYVSRLYKKYFGFTITQALSQNKINDFAESDQSLY